MFNRPDCLRDQISAEKYDRAILKGMDAFANGSTIYRHGSPYTTLREYVEANGFAYARLRTLMPTHEDALLEILESGRPLWEEALNV